MDARQRERGTRVNFANVAMRHRASKNGGMQKSGPHDVVDILAPPAQKPQVFQPLDRAANQGVANTQ